MDTRQTSFPQSPTCSDTILDGSRFVRACLRKPVDRTPVWFLRQAGRYMQEYRDVRKHHTLVEICKQPEIAAEVTITAAEKLGVDAAIIFADLLLPLEPMGLPFEFQAGEGPVVHHPVRTAEDVRALRTDRADELAYVARAIREGGCAFPRPAGHYRLLRCAVHAGQLHDRGRRLEELHPHQADDVSRPAFVAVAAGQAGEGAGGVLPAAGAGGRGRDPDFRQLGWLAGAGGLSRVRV